MDLLDMIVKSMIELDEDKMIKLVKKALVANIPKVDIMASLSKGLDLVGEKYANDEYVLYDLMMSGIVYEDIVNLDEMNLYDTLVSEHKKGTIVLGTIQGDIHDIGKSVFKNAATLSGFNVIDLGVDVSSELFIDAIYTYKPDILGISIVLTDVVKNAVATLEKIRGEGFKNLKIIIGGVAANSLKDAFPDIDACTNNVLQGLELCSNMVKCHEKKH